MESIYKQRCGSLFCFLFWRHQNSQVDLFAKSEIFNGVDVVGDAACVTPLEGSGGMLPKEILKNRCS